MTEPLALCDCDGVAGSAVEFRVGDSPRGHWTGIRERGLLGGRCESSFGFESRLVFPRLGRGPMFTLRRGVVCL